MQDAVSSLSWLSLSPSPSLKSLKMTQFPILSYSKLFFEWETQAYFFQWMDLVYCESVECFRLGYGREGDTIVVESVEGQMEQLLSHANICCV